MVKSTHLVTLDDSSFSDICSPMHCNLDTLCLSNENPFFNGNETIGCCSGGPSQSKCAIISDGLDSCEQKSTCSPTDQNDLVCVLNSKTSTQWIGVVITLVAAATLNVGLNLQKLALRKRFEKNMIRKENERSRLLTRLASIKISLSNLYKNMSTPSLNSFGKSNTETSEIPMQERQLNTDIQQRQGDILVYQEIRGPRSAQSDSAIPRLRVGTDQTHTDLNTIENEIPSEPNQNENGQGNTLSVVEDIVDRPSQDSNEVRNSLAQRTPKDMPEFQKKLGMSGLFKNPRWMLGFIVFFFGNILNVIALQFAPQSLVAPLGSISLVVNVIIAPWLNNEQWGYRDIVGVILIVGGSSMVVAFAGSNQHDYCLSVLLALFKRFGTILFLSVTSVSIVIIFFAICFIEKNMDLGPKSVNTRSLNRTLDVANVAAIEANPQREIDSSSKVIRNKNGLQVLVQDECTQDGHRQRRITLTDKSPVDKNYVIPDPLYPPSSIGEILSSPIRDEDNRSIKSISLVFNIDKEDTKEDEDDEATQGEEELEEDGKSIEPQIAIPRLQTTSSFASWKLSLKDHLKNTKLYQFYKKTDIIPKLKEPIPLDSRLVRIVLPFSYASLGVIFIDLGFNGHFNRLVCQGNRQFADAEYFPRQQSIHPF